MLARAAAVLFLATSVVACGGSDDASDPTEDTTSVTTTTIVVTADGVLRVRPVLSLLVIDDMPIGSFGDDDPAADTVSANLARTLAYDLGPSVAEEDDVVGAEAAMEAGEWVVRVTLSEDATADLRDLAEACLASKRRCEQGRVAVTVDGAVLADIAVVDARIGPTLTLTGGLNETQAQVVADALG